MQGKTLASVTTAEGDRLIFTCSDGSEYLMFHDQDCCESVYLEDVNGDWANLIGSPLLVSEDVNSEEDPPAPNEYGHDDSHTWTFYKFATIKGSVSLRWYGSSNGYYSESVDFCQTKEPSND